MSPSTRSKPRRRAHPRLATRLATRATRATRRQADRDPVVGAPRVELEVSRQARGGLDRLRPAVRRLLVWEARHRRRLGRRAADGLRRVQRVRAAPDVPPRSGGRSSSNDHQVVLPPRAVHAPPDQDLSGRRHAVYFLRRSVPWNRSAPVLVSRSPTRRWRSARLVRLRADQRHVIHALLRNGRSMAMAPGEISRQGRDRRHQPDRMDPDGRGLRADRHRPHRFILSESQSARAANYALYVGPIVAGVICCGAFTRW